VPNDTDIVDDATVHRPEERPLIDLGRIALTAPVAENAREQKKIIFDPIPRVDGIDPSDPLLELPRSICQADVVVGKFRRAETKDRF
jgi:catalase